MFNFKHNAFYSKFFLNSEIKLSKVKYKFITVNSLQDMENNVLILLNQLEATIIH